MQAATKSEARDFVARPAPHYMPSTFKWWGMVPTITTYQENNFLFYLLNVPWDCEFGGGLDIRGIVVGRRVDAPGVDAPRGV